MRPRCLLGWLAVVRTLLLLIAAGSPLVAQTERWEYRSVTTEGEEKYSPQVALDRAGNTHITWVSKDPTGPGLQLFYTTNAAGGFHAPMQVADTGTVVDTTLSRLTPHAFHLDPSGSAHIAFMAQVPTATYGTGVFHTTNRALSNPAGEFQQPRKLLDSNLLQYDIAVDSLGNLHLVWLDPRIPDEARFYYWNSRIPTETKLIATRRCQGMGCQIGNLELEAGSNGLVLAFRSDSGSVYLIRQTGSGFLPIEKVQGILPYDATATAVGRADLRVRMALGGDGRIHLLYPHFDAARQHRIVHSAGFSGQFTTSLLNPAPFDTAAADLDLAWNGSDRVAAVWSVHPTVQQSGLPRVGFGELVDGNADWRVIGELNRELGADGAIWKDGVRIAALGEQIAIVGINRMGGSAGRQIGLIHRSSVVPTIRYIHPDVAAPGMSVVVEALAASRGWGSFGPDGFRKDSVTMEVVNPGDAGRLIFGPSVVSWDGRLVSTMVFVHPDAAIGPVPVRLRINGRLSNVQTFEIVTPRMTGVMQGGGIIGGRSRRGVVVVDSLILRGGVFTFDTTDTDPQSPGNQGFLPVTILSRGAVRIASDAVLSVSARHDSALKVFGTAGPGGGGGGVAGAVGGSGFTPGGGSGVVASLNGAPGGTVLPSGPGGGGTGHPFGTSGGFGRISPRSPIAPNAGGNAAGAGGVQMIEGGTTTYGGGGGGNASAGGSSGATGNGGRPTGNAQLVPLAGGSGGGGGGYAPGGIANGGGGGGAIAIISYAGMEIKGPITADGAPGVNIAAVATTSGGGGGAGGSILLGSRDTIHISGAGAFSAVGGIEGKKTSSAGSADGGQGGSGRIRIDGKISASAFRSNPSPSYTGPAIMLRSGVMARSGDTISGVAARSDGGSSPNVILLYTRPKDGDWGYDAPYSATVGTDGSWSVVLNSSADADELYVVAMQKVHNPIHDEFIQSPGWVISPVGGAILGRPRIDSIPDTLRFECIDYDLCGQRDITIGNPSTLTELSIRSIQVVGRDSAAFVPSASSIRVGPRGSQILTIHFCPKDTGTFEAELLLHTNLIPQSDGVRRIRLIGCAVSGKGELREQSIDFGEICPEDCRDTTIRLYNRGKGNLTVEKIEGNHDAIQVTLLGNEKPPFTLAAGDSIDIPVRICLTRVTRNGIPITITAKSVYPVPTLLVRGTNLGPEYSMPDGRNFGLVLMRRPPSCSTLIVPIRNISRTLPLQIRLGKLIGDPNFSVKPAVLDTVLPPGGELDLEVTFCPDAEREYSGQLPIIFGGGSCEVDTDVKFYGRGELPRPKFVIRDPRHDPADGIRRLHFQKMSINAPQPSSRQYVTVMNEGTAPGELLTPELRNGDVADFIIGTMVQNLDEKEWSSLSVQFKPRSVGVKRAWLYVADASGVWRDSVELEGEGARPGIQICDAGINFGELRRGEVKEGYICFFNDGQIVDTLRGLTSVRGAFEFLRITVIRNGAAEREQSLPIAIEPGGQTEVRMYYRFSPTKEGVFDTTVGVVYGNNERFTFYLRGSSVLEHISSDSEEIDFGCLMPGEDSSATFTVSNSGTYPLTILDIDVTGDDFALLGPEPPPLDVLQPGETRTYTVGFTPRSVSATGVVIITSSDPDRRRLSIYLRGTICEPYDQPTINLTISDTTQVVGDEFVLPIHADLNLVLADTVAYRLVITYPYDLLLPLLPEPGNLPQQIPGTISSAVLMEEERPGELVINGSILEREQRGILVKIPFRVLLGSHYTDSIRFKLTDIPAARVVRTRNALFQALDCDTSNGGVILRGTYTLDQNRPNPFNPATVIPYSIPRRDRVRLLLYDAAGQLVRVLLDEEQGPGEYRYILSADELSSGVYICEMISGRFRKMVRMVLME